MSAAPTTTPPISTVFKGIVKQVLSGDSIVVRGQPKGGPPPERQINFSNISAPKLCRRPTGNLKPEDVKDEPWAWESREFLRKKIIGKEVLFIVDHKVAASNREYGTVYFGKDIETGECLSEAVVSEGLATVRREGKADTARLIELEEAAKAARKGKWSDDGETHVRDIVWSVENPRTLLDKFSRKPVPAVIEHVRDGSSIRVFLLPSFHYITLTMSGIRCPGFKFDNEGKPDPSQNEPFADEARYFTESRLLQRDVQVVLESVNNQNYVGSVIHPNGNIAELLLKEGFAKCVDWSMGFVTGGAEVLRAAEKAAKEKKLRIWKNYQAAAGGLEVRGKDRDFYATVIEIVNGDAMKIKLADGTVKKIFLASIRPPRNTEERGGGDASGQRDKSFRPLYDIPFMYEARETLRKRLIGKKVHVVVDFIQQADEKFPEKICCTVKSEGTNMGELLVGKGLATVVRYREDVDQRASEYDSLLAAEAKAQKAGRGLFGKDTVAPHIIDLSGDAAKAKQFLPYLQRAGRSQALVEFVASGSRLRLYVPKESRLITLLLAGISCPRGERPAPGGKGEMISGEPYGNEALALSKDLCLQREVEIEVEAIDKAGNFIGWLWIDGKNLSVALVEEGLASVHFSAERSNYYRALQNAESSAKNRRIKIWKDYEDLKDEVRPEDDQTERKVEQKAVVVTEVTPELHVFVQFAKDGGKLEELMSAMRKDLSDKPPLTGAYTPKRGDLCVAKYSADGEWYRARIEKILPNHEASVLFIDYGNREVVKTSKCAPLPATPSVNEPPFAKEYGLACIALSNDEDYIAEAVSACRQDTAEGTFLMNSEYKANGIEYITLVNESTKEDEGQRLVREGLLLVENRKERRLQKLMKDYKAAEKEARDKHFGIWQYGDITEDDAREFGISAR